MTDNNHDLQGNNHDPDGMTQASINIENYKATLITEKFDDASLQQQLEANNTGTDVKNGDLQLTGVTVYFQSNTQMDASIKELTTQLQRIYGSGIEVTPIVNPTEVSRALRENKKPASAKAFEINLTTSLK